MRKLPFEYAVRNLGRSPSRLLMSAGGCGLVVLLAMAAGGFVNGMQNSLTISGSPRNVILMGAGSEESVERSEIPMRTPGIAATGIRGIVIAAGVEAISPEVHLAIPVQLQSAGDSPPEAVETNALFRGITPSAFLVHQEARLTDGRFPETGADEVAIGRLAARSLGLEDTDGILGSTLIVDERPFSIVGVGDA
ncbi:MAG: ABC transporter permease, partial [Phycisphaerales bacterium]